MQPSVIRCQRLAEQVQVGEVIERFGGEVPVGMSSDGIVKIVAPVPGNPKGLKFFFEGGGSTEIKDATTSMITVAVHAPSPLATSWGQVSPGDTVREEGGMTRYVVEIDTASEDHPGRLYVRFDTGGSTRDPSDLVTILNWDPAKEILATGDHRREPARFDVMAFLATKGSADAIGAMRVLIDQGYHRDPDLTELLRAKINDEWQNLKALMSQAGFE